MTRRKTPKNQTRTQQNNQELVLMGDVRQAPIEIHDGGRSFRPVVALWVRAEDGTVVGQMLDEPGQPAQTLIQALRAPIPIPGQTQTPSPPSRVILFDEDLARQVKALPSFVNIEVMVASAFKPFDDLFASLFASLELATEASLLPDLPDDALRLLVSAAERLWRAKPWQYTSDYPPFAVASCQSDAEPLYASILGANQELLGVALYTSLTDFEANLMLGGSMVGPEALEADAAELMDSIRDRTFLVSFDSKGVVPQVYCDQLAELGWPRRLSAVPT
jgi:hypothetical protein